MCGIAGFVECGGNWEEKRLEEQVGRMTSCLRHRGPDSGGFWVNPTSGIALGHRRLAVIDLSPAGHQPMQSADGRYVVTYNGEIYNFREIRRELAALGHSFAGSSDTEVMLAAFREWGVESVLAKFVGMFAFGVWDRKARTLYLARDRMGEKPLYYGWCGSAMVFGSELKALKAHPQWRGEIDRDVVALFLRHNCIPAPYSIFRGIRKLLPGSFLPLAVDRATPGSLPEPVPYWSLRHVVEEGTKDPFRGTEREAVEQLEALLKSVVAGQMISDVPLGAFLSGGVDSSAVVALMQAQTRVPVKTFTIGFTDKRYSEADRARCVAQHLGTDHAELYVTAEQAMAVIPKLSELYDEPFSDSSQIPTYLLSELTREHVTVSLSGDGGDELFAGYNRHFRGREIWQRTGWLPMRLRKGAADSLLSVSPQAWDRVFDRFGHFLPERYRETLPGARMHKLAEVLTSESPAAMYRGVTSHWKDPASIVLGSSEPPTILGDPSNWPCLDDFSARMMYLDQLTYLPNDILVKVDRAGMGVSLETRMPFLDHRVVEFSWRIPVRMNLREGRGKWLLRQVLNKYVPLRIFEGTKQGFGIPLGIWLRGPLREWVEDLLAPDRIRSEGFLNPAPIIDRWNEHLSGRFDWEYLLWDVLTFQAWLAGNRGPL